MEKHIRESINDNILKEACGLYGISLENINELNGFENFVYDFKKGNTEYILRLVHSDHRDYSMVLAEIEFINYLAQNGANVSSVFQSLTDSIVEKVFINDKDYFSVAAFTKGKGIRVNSQTRTDSFWEKLGEQIGLFHSLTKNFVPKHQRKEWQYDFLYLNASNILGNDKEVLKKLKELTDKILSLPRDKDNYGLIHTDIHEGNMVIDESGHFTIFDFDDSAYKHFISDIAIVIFYQFAFREFSIDEKNIRAVSILKSFIKGYFKKNQLPIDEFQHLNTFLKLREITLYMALKSAGPEVTKTDWAKWYFSFYRDKIIDDTPFIDVSLVLENVF